MAAYQGNLEMVSIALQMSVLSMRERVHLLPVRSSRVPQISEEVKAPWNWRTAASALNGHLHILEYLVERKYDQYDGEACENAAKYGHLDCLKYLHENRQSALELWSRTRSAREKPHRVFTIPPRQRLSSPTVGDTKMERYARRKRVLGYTKREREREIRSYCEINNIYTNNLNQNTPLNDANRRARIHNAGNAKKNALAKSSIYRPLGYGPNALPPRQFAFFAFVCGSRIGFSCVYLNAQCKP